MRKYNGVTDIYYQYTIILLTSSNIGLKQRIIQLR